MIADLNIIIKLLRSYLTEFPEHDQGDFRVWEAVELLERLVEILEPYKPKRSK